MGVTHISEVVKVENPKWEVLWSPCLPTQYKLEILLFAFSPVHKVKGAKAIKLIDMANFKRDPFSSAILYSIFFFQNAMQY